MDPAFDQILQVVRSFQESRALLTAIELNLFGAVGSGADGASVAKFLKSDPRATEMLLNTIVAMGLLSKSSGIFRHTPDSERYFLPDSPDYARPALMHMVHLWDRWSTLTACVRNGTAQAGGDIGARSEDWTQAFIAAMDRNAAERAPHVVRAVGTAGVRRMLDVGGGSGAYSIAFVKASRDLKAEILDLETVLGITQSHIEAAGLTERITIRPGDLRVDELGESFDLVFVSQICHMLDEAENQGLIRRCLSATAAGGRTIIQDFILEPDKTAPKSAALFALNMLVGTRAGSSYSSEEYFAWMKEAGFGEVKHVRLPGPSGLIIGTRPK
jgi:predicted O-methyltransferase YrrM